MINLSKSPTRKRFVRDDQLDAARTAAARIGIANLEECRPFIGCGVYLAVNDDDWTMIKTMI